MRARARVRVRVRDMVRVRVRVMVRVRVRARVRVRTRVSARGSAGCVVAVVTNRRIGWVWRGCAIQFGSPRLRKDI